jgi:transcription initiation factor TFIIF subunit alpha
MSATPPNPPPGRTPPGGPNGPLLKMRRPKAADPLVRPKKKPLPRPAQLPNPLLPNSPKAAATVATAVNCSAFGR